MADNATKQAVMSGKKEVSKNGIAQEILQQLNFNLGSVFNSKLSSFENYSYEAKGPVSQESVDSGAKSHIESQIAKINDAVQAEFEKQVAKAKEALESAKNDTEFTTMESEYNQAKQSFETHLGQDGLFADVADFGSKIYNNPLGERMGISTGNTASMVRRDLDKCGKLINDFKKTTDPNKRAQIKQEIKSMNIKERVEKYNQSQEDGAKVVEIGAGVVASATLGPMGGALVVGGAKFADSTVKDIKQDKFDLTSSEGLLRVGENLAGGVVDGAIAFGAGKAVTGVGGIITKTGIADDVMNAVAKNAVKGSIVKGSSIATKAGVKVIAKGSAKVGSETGVGQLLSQLKEGISSGVINNKNDALAEINNIKQAAITNNFPLGEINDLEALIKENYG